MQVVEGGENVTGILEALENAKAETDRPSFIRLRTVIAFPAPKAMNTGKAHGSALGADEVRAVKEILGFDPEKVNPNGSGISLGHPVGATGAIITTKAIAELHRTGGRHALVTMCIGGGQGLAAVIDRAV